MQLSKFLEDGHIRRVPWQRKLPKCFFLSVNRMEMLSGSLKNIQKNNFKKIFFYTKIYTLLDMQAYIFIILCRYKIREEIPMIDFFEEKNEDE